MFKSAIAVLALGAAVNAIKVEMPDKETLWQSGGGAQTVAWEAVSTDATSFAIQLVNQVSGWFLFYWLARLPTCVS